MTLGVTLSGFGAITRRSPAEETSLAREWEFYTAPGGGRPVERDLQKAGLSKWEAGRLAELMDRVRDGRARPGTDFKPLRDDVRECRLTGHNRIFRLMYAEVEGGLVLLALHFIVKKKRNDRDAVEVAVLRLADWRRRQSKGP